MTLFEQVAELIQRQREIHAVPGVYRFTFHPDDRAEYAPAVALVLDEARRYRDVGVEVIEDDRCPRNVEGQIGMHYGEWRCGEA